MTTIRKANMNDLEEIRHLNHKLFLFDYPNDQTLNTDWPNQQAGEEYFTKRINNETGMCFVAEDSGKLIGYVTGRVYDEIDKTDTLLRSELDNIYVEEAVRGSGIGRDLVLALEEWCKNLGAQRMFVVAYSGNQSAINFYETYGFKPYALKLEHVL